MSGDIQLCFQMKRGAFQLDIDTSIPGTGVTAVFGRSGSGKTSLLRCIAGLEKADHAFLSVQGKVWQDSTRGIFLPPYRREIGYVFQEGALFPQISVRKNLLFGYRRTPFERRKADFDRVVELLGIGSLLDRLPAYLSGGEKQRVAIGRALLNHPRLLLMDEPMASLDQAHKREILPYLESLHQSFDIPIIYITHDREELVHIANHMLLIENGSLIAEGSTEYILTRVDLPIAREHEASSVIEARVVEHDHTFYLTKLEFEGGDLFVNWLNREVGSRLRLQIRAKDVIIAREKPQQSSILNIFPATVEEMQAHGRGRMVVRLNIAGVHILARITQTSQFLLNLKVGDQVFAEMKSMAIVL